MIQKQQEVSGETAISGKVVLLVEDDAVNAECLTAIISEETDYHVLVASNALAALKFVRHTIPDLFILDYELPEMNGIELLDHLQINKVLKHVPVIILSAALERCRTEIRKRQLIGISKPFDLDELLYWLDELVG